jgi:hypothetical protein
LRYAGRLGHGEDFSPAVRKSRCEFLQVRLALGSGSGVARARGRPHSSVGRCFRSASHIHRAYPSYLVYRFVWLLLFIWLLGAAVVLCCGSTPQEGSSGRETAIGLYESPARVGPSLGSLARGARSILPPLLSRYAGIAASPLHGPTVKQSPYGPGMLSSHSQ